MSPMMFAVVGLSVLVGLSLGLLGGGGSILVVPLLTYLGGMEPREAIASSLFVVGVTSLVSLVQHARAGRVRWRTGLLFGAAGMVGAFGGGLLGGHIPGAVLMVAFALMMVATATAMLRPRKTAAGGGAASSATGGGAGTATVSGAAGGTAGTATGGTAGGGADAAGAHPVWRILLDGLVVGAATGLVGAGGGFLVVPALVLLAGLPMSAAVGTSLLVIALKSFAGLGGYLTTVSLNWPVVLAVTAAAVVGSFGGVALSSRVPDQALRRGFGFFVLVMGVIVLAQELPTAAGVALVLVAVLAAAVAVAMCLFTTRCPFRGPASDADAATPAGAAAPGVPAAQAESATPTEAAAAGSPGTSEAPGPATNPLSFERA